MSDLSFEERLKVAHDADAAEYQLRLDAAKERAWWARFWATRESIQRASRRDAGCWDD